MTNSKTSSMVYNEDRKINIDNRQIYIEKSKICTDNSKIKIYYDDRKINIDNIGIAMYIAMPMQDIQYKKINW